MNTQILKIKRGSGAPTTLSTGELAIDTLNKSLFVGTNDGPIVIGGEHVFAKKTYADSAVGAEATLRSAADSTLTTNLAAEVARATAAEGVLTTNLAAEVTRATAAEGVLTTNLAAEVTARTNAVSSEATARASADTNLDGKISTEKGRIDAILSASQADKDSFKEIVDLINSVDTTNDQAFAGYVLSNNAALAAEIHRAASKESDLQNEIDNEVFARQTAISDLASEVASDIADEVSAREAAVSALQTALNDAVGGLNFDIVRLDNRVSDEEANRIIADTLLSDRIFALETVIDGGSY